MSEPLWVPSADRIARARLTAFMRAVRRRLGVEASSYDDLYRFSIERPEDFWRTVWTFTGIRRRDGQPRRGRPRQDAGRAVLSRRAAQLRGEPPEAPRDERRPSSSTAKGSRRRTLSDAELHAEVARCAAALRRGRHSSGRSRRGLHAEHARDDRRGARGGRDRRGVVVVLAGLRRAGRPGSLRADRAAAARRLRRLLLRREDARRAAPRGRASPPRSRRSNAP